MVGIVKEINGQKKIIPLTADTGTDVPMAMYVDMTNLVLQTSGTYSNYSDTYITIEYTKTTD